MSNRTNNPTLAHCEKCWRDMKMLTAVAVAARALSRTAKDFDIHHSIVSEAELVALESALEDAVYGMTDEDIAEFDRSLEA